MSYSIPSQAGVRLRSSKAVDKGRPGYLLYKVKVPYGRDFPTLYAIYLPARARGKEQQPDEVRYLRNTQFEGTDRPTTWLTAACCDPKDFPEQATPNPPYPA